MTAYTIFITSEKIVTVEADLVIVGAGAAGLAAAWKAAETGIKRILLLERTEIIGGILLQCIHPGFGLHIFREDLSGPEFLYKLLEYLEKYKDQIEIVTNAYVHGIETTSYYKKLVKAMTPKGLFYAETKAVIYTAGARERSIFELGIVGDRVAGVFTAGEAQTLMDIYGVLPGRKILIVGSGDVGLIMARRLYLEGAEVVGVVEMMPYPSGLTKNIVQCLKDFNIPLHLNHKALAVRGAKRVKKVVIAKVDKNLEPVPGDEKEIECDAVIIAAGLTPDINILEDAGAAIDPTTGGPIVNDFLETTVPGIHVAGNALVINDLVDNAAEQGYTAAKSVSTFMKEGGLPALEWTRVRVKGNVRFFIPHMLSGFKDVKMYGRSKMPQSPSTLEIPEINKKRKITAVKPAEMVTFTLKKEEIRKAGKTITIVMK